MPGLLLLGTNQGIQRYQNEEIQQECNIFQSSTPDLELACGEPLIHPLLGRRRG